MKKLQVTGSYSASWGILFLAALFSSGCASKKVESGSGPVLAAPEKSSKPLEASPIDASKPPTVTLSGVGEGDLVLASSMKIKVAITNYPVSENWQQARVILNNAQVARVTTPSDTLEISDGLKEGVNRIVVYLARSWGESIKTPTAFASVTFFYKKKDASLAHSSNPGLVLVSPTGTYSGESAKKLPFDFLVVQNQGRKYRVYYTLDGETREVSSEGAPFPFYNLPPGNHQLKVELIDSKGKPVKAPFSQGELSFRIE